MPPTNPTTWLIRECRQVPCMQHPAGPAQQRPPSILALGADQSGKGKRGGSPGQIPGKNSELRDTHENRQTHTLSLQRHMPTAPATSWRARCGTYRNGRRKSSLVHVNQCVPKACTPAWLHDRPACRKRWRRLRQAIVQRGTHKLSSQCVSFNRITLQAGLKEALLDTAHCPRSP